MTTARLARIALVLLLGVGTASCAYYNTFYLARKYYMKATDGEPYEVDREGTTQRSNYTKSGDYSKKLLGVYPKSKWVDDAWLMWARTLIGTDDPLKAVTMLEEFQTRFPRSELRPDAEFFLGLAYRAARKHELAIASFEEFLVLAPRHPLVPYAWYERSKALMSLQRYGEAAESAGQILQKFRGHPLADRALRQRAEARYQQHDWAGAQADFHTIGLRALTDEERLKFLLREVDCLESSRDYERARATLRDARSHTVPPPPLPVAPRVPSTPSAGALPVQQMSVVRSPAQEVYGRLTLRMGGVEVLDGHVDQGVELYRSVIADYPRSQLAAEAQYRIGFAYETGANDFARARAEYAKVREQVGSSQFAQQADQRLENLDRIERFRTAGGADSLARQAEARFLTAELYLYSQDKPERAADEYRAIADSSSQPAVRARALTARAWVLARKLGKKEAADSLFWQVVREYPATEAQLAARDYLEADGQMVPEELIVAPTETAKPVVDPADEALTPTPTGTTPLGGRKREPGLTGPGAAAPSAAAPTAAGSPPAYRYNQLPDSLRRAMMLRDSILSMARRDTSAAGRARVDSLHRAMARADTVGRAALKAEIARQVGKVDNVVVAPEDAPPPDFAADTTSSGGRAGAPPAPSVPSAQLPASARLPAAPRAGVPAAIVQADSARRVGGPRVKAAADSAGRSLAGKPDSTSKPAARVPAVSRRMSRADSLRARLAADSLRVLATADSIRTRAAADSVRAAFEAERRKVVTDSLAQVAELRRTRAQADSLARARAAADSLAAQSGRKGKVKPPSDPNVGFSSVWEKAVPDSAKLAKKRAALAKKQAEQEQKRIKEAAKRKAKEQAERDAAQAPKDK